jgi:hypothetical protein
LDLKVPITLSDELTEDVITATAWLDLASGEIRGVEYEDYDVQARGVPVHLPDYEFTCGTLSNRGRDLEFQVQVNRATGQYAVSADELLEIKKRAAALFAAPPKG